MKEVEMDPVIAGDLVIEGGWRAKVPEVTPDQHTFDVYVDYVIDKVGNDPERAEQIVLDVIQEVFERAFIRGLEYSVRYRAKQFAERWPDLVTDDGRLQGFDPAIMQSAYFPSENVGRKGKQFAWRLMEGMARDVR